VHFFDKARGEFGGLGTLEEEEEGAKTTPVQEDGEDGQVLGAGEGGREGGEGG